jgi:DNA adenine methylase
MNGPLKWHGGKHYLAPKVWDLIERQPWFPSIVHVGEPYCGGASFALEGLARGHQLSFFINDLDAELMNFWSVLQNRPLFDEFHRIVTVTPFAEPEFETCREFLDGARPDIPLDAATGLDGNAALAVAKATAFFVVCRQSLAGRMDAFAPLSRRRTRRGMNEQVSAWLTAGRHPLRGRARRDPPGGRPEHPVLWCNF